MLSKWLARHGVLLFLLQPREQRSSFVRYSVWRSDGIDEAFLRDGTGKTRGYFGNTTFPHMVRNVLNDAVRHKCMCRTVICLLLCLCFSVLFSLCFCIRQSASLKRLAVKTEYWILE
jgi:hypothetical protein